MRAWVRVAAIAVVGMASNCTYGPYEFVCTDNSSCGAGGKCEPGFNLCSFPNEAQCGPGGRAFGDLGGPSSGKCVGSVPAVVPPCYGAPPFTVCFTTAPTGMINISSPTTLDTGTGIAMGIPLTCTNPSSGGAGYCVLAASDITIGAKLRAIGTKPLVLVATGTIDISSGTSGGMIDVGSRGGHPPEMGAGSKLKAACVSGVPGAGNGGGGAGGSFLGAGGAGGAGNGAMNGGGAAGAVSNRPLAVRGGCPGQPGQWFVGFPGDTVGPGGGAVFLIAGRSIRVAGTINAGGAGGGGGLQECSTVGGCPGPAAGGNGGGAGGMIGLDAPSIMVTGTLGANGGGGGEGDGSGSAMTGNDGQDAASTSAAAGGGPHTPGGAGGSGSSGLGNGSGGKGKDAMSCSDCGGGGGGGGAGFIQVSTGADLSGAAVSPPPTP